MRAWSKSSSYRDPLGPATRRLATSWETDPKRADVKNTVSRPCRNGTNPDRGVLRELSLPSALLIRIWQSWDLQSARLRERAGAPRPTGNADQSAIRAQDGSSEQSACSCSLAVWSSVSRSGTGPGPWERGCHPRPRPFRIAPVVTKSDPGALRRQKPLPAAGRQILAKRIVGRLELGVGPLSRLRRSTGSCPAWSGRSPQSSADHARRTRQSCRDPEENDWRKTSHCSSCSMKAGHCLDASNRNACRGMPAP